MVGENSTIAHLSVAMTMDAVDETQTAAENTMPSSSSRDAQFYFGWATVVMGVLGTAGNALILYALIAAKQHKKLPLIVNQNVLDLFASFFLVISYALKLANMSYIGAAGYWLCITLHGELLVTIGIYGSRVNLAAIAVERYLKVVHHVWSKNKLRRWMINSAMAFSWLLGALIMAPFLFISSRVKDGLCCNMMYASMELIMAYVIWYSLSFYMIIFAILIFCYGRILVAIRRQAKVMASHSAAGPSTAQTHQSNQIQTNVINTMILVSALYVISHLLQAVIYLDTITGSNLGINGSVNNVSRFIQFSFVTANPLISALKFDPVKKILKGMMPSRLAVWFNHVMSFVTSIGNRTSTTHSDQELADMRGRE